MLVPASGPAPTPYHNATTVHAAATSNATATPAAIDADADAATTTTGGPCYSLAYQHRDSNPCAATHDTAPSTQPNHTSATNSLPMAWGTVPSAAITVATYYGFFKVPPLPTNFKAAMMGCI